MADLKITQLTAYNPPIGSDLLAIVDVTAGITKKVTVTDLLALAPSGGIALTDLSAVAPLAYDNTTGVFTTSMATGKLIGRSTAGVGVMEEITIGAGLDLTAGVLTAPDVPPGTSGQTLRYDSSNVLVANDVLKNDGDDIFIGDGTANTGRLLSTINSLLDRNIILKNLNAGGETFIQIQDSAGANQYQLGMSSGTLKFIIPSGIGMSLDTNGKVKITQNNASYYDALTLQNLNSSAPVYLTFQNSAGAEKFYSGYRQASARFDIVSDALYGMAVDSTGRTLVGLNIGAYVAPDAAYMLTVDSVPAITSYGMVLRRNEGAGGTPIAAKLFNSSNAYVEYANITPAIVSNTAGSHTGKIIFATATAGTVTDKIVIDSSGNITPTTTGVGALGTTSLKWSELVVTNPVAVIYGGTGKTSIAANKMLVALSSNTYSETGYFDVTEQAIASTISFSGTAPTTPINIVYRWSQVGNKVDVQFNLNYTNAGAAITGMTIAKPADMPDPAQPSSFTGASTVICYGSGTSQTSLTGLAGNHKAYLRRNAANNGYEFGLDSPSAAYKCFWIRMSYFTT